MESDVNIWAFWNLYLVHPWGVWCGIAWFVPSGRCGSYMICTGGRWDWCMIYTCGPVCGLYWQVLHCMCHKSWLLVSWQWQTSSEISKASDMKI